MSKTIQEFEIPTAKGGKPHKVRAYRCEVPGIVIHKDPADEGRGWVVSHESSGRSIIPKRFRTKKLATEYAEEIGPLASWDVDHDQLRHLSDVAQECLRKAREYLYR